MDTPTPIPTTRAKFVVDSITTGRAGVPTNIKFSAVYPASDGSDGFAHDENHAFWNATPYGTIDIGIQNALAAELFQGGDEFYVDFVKVPKLDAA